MAAQQELHKTGTARGRTVPLWSHLIQRGLTVYSENIRFTAMAYFIILTTELRL